jgi:hypothetical protein
MALPADVQFIGYVTRIGPINGEGLFFPIQWVITMDPGDGLPVDGVFDVTGLKFPLTEAEIVAALKEGLASHLSDVYGETISVDKIIGCYPA